MSEKKKSKSIRWIYLVLGILVIWTALLVLLRIIPPVSGLGELALPTGSITPQRLFTEIAQTREVARLTPKITLPPPSPVTGQDSTPDYSTVPHRYLEDGVIIDQGASDSLALCFRDEEGAFPWIRNQWMPLDHPPYPYLVVYAGGIGEERPPLQGAVFIWDIEVDRDPCALEAIVTPYIDGPVEIIAVQGKELLLRSLTSGDTLAFDAETRVFMAELSTPTPGPSPTPDPDITPPSSLGDYAIYASHSIVIGPRARVYSGSTGARTDEGGYIELKNDIATDLYGSIVADGIKIGPENLILSDFFYNKLNAHKSTEFLGRLFTPVDLSIDLPPMPDIPEDLGTSDLIVSNGTEEVVAPGDYRSIRVKSDGKAILTPGIYNIGDVRLDNGAEMTCTGRCNLRVRDGFVLGPNAKLQHANIAIYDFIIYIAGADGFSAGQGSRVRANVVAPEGMIELGPRGVYTGGFYGWEIDIQNDASISSVSAFLE